METPALGRAYEHIRTYLGSDTLMNLPGTNDLISGGFLGVWAFLGAVMKSGADWRDPETKKFSYARLGTALATALVLGQGAGALGNALHWEAAVIGLVAAILGYLGPAVAMALLEKRFVPGVADAKPDPGSK